MAIECLLFGRNGQVGWQLQRSLSPLGGVVALDSAACDLRDAAAVARAIRETQPKIIVNAAAYTAVDQAEREEDLARRINAEAPGVMAEEAKRLGALLVHYSTDYVFDGRKDGAYVETDATAPQSAYGRSKRDGELAIAAAGASAVIFRTSWVFGVRGGNFVKTILRLARERDSLRVVADQVGSPTPAAMIADVSALTLHRLRRERPTGAAIYHLAAARPVSWHEFATTIVERARTLGNVGYRLKPEAIEAITTAEYPLPAARPANSRLDCRKLETSFDLTLPDWLPYLERSMSLLATERP